MTNNGTTNPANESAADAAYTAWEAACDRFTTASEAVRKNHDQSKAASLRAALAAASAEKTTLRAAYVAIRDAE